MKKAMWKGETLAASDKTIEVEGNAYFPMESLDKKFFKPSSTHTTCSWKGEASYFTLEVAGAQNVDAAWFYPAPKDAAKNITNYVAFWKGVQVSG